MIQFNNELPFTKEEKLKIEENIYSEMAIPENIVEEVFSIEKVMERDTKLFVEKDYNSPQNIFFIELENGYKLFGRKTLSIMNRTGRLTSLNCSRISKEMIVGILKKANYNEPKIEIEYFPLNKGEKINIFKKIKQDMMTNIYFPYRFYDFYTRKERESPKNGWKVYENLPIYLARGEEHFRKYTIDFLSKVSILPNMVFYDPACSSGDFLEEIQKHYKTVTTIGCDLSKEMVAIARNKLDEVHCENAFYSSLKNESVDYLFLRFLNFRVVTYETAHKLYNVLIEKVKTNGFVICFGHTPVLLEKEYMRRKNLKILSCSGYEEENDSLFQYYVLKKISN
jgi:SAM-dependent methyltransferase